MHKDNVTGLTEYDSFEEILNADIRSAFENSEYYYVRLEPEFQYDGRAYRIEKLSNKVECIHMIDMAEECSRGGAKQIDPKTIKRAS